MKLYWRGLLTLVFGLAGIQVQLMAQPGPPPPVNLNEFTGTQHSITIDSTSDLGKIKVLNKENYPGTSLELNLFLSKIPAEFAGFTHIESLNLICGAALQDLSGLNYFTHLKALHIYNFEGTLLSKGILLLDSLRSLRIGRSKTLTDINAMVTLGALEELEIFNCPAITVFPKLNNKSSLRHLYLENGNGFEYWDRETDRKADLDLTNLQFLDKVEFFHLGGYSCFREIPECLPRSITTLKLMGRGYPTPNDKIELENLDNLKLYPHLKELHLYGLLLEKIDGNFKNLSLNILSLHSIFNLSDISGIFTFKSIHTVKISQCPFLEYVKSKDKNCRIDLLDFNDLPRLQNIYFLFECKNIRQLEIREASPALFIPELKRMDNIPDMLLYKSGAGYHLYKKENVWEITVLDKKS